MYFNSTGVGDDCKNVPDDVLEVEMGMELKGFDCNGMELGEMICMCVGEKINGKVSGYTNLCGDCDMAVRPKKEFIEKFQFWRYYSHMLGRALMETKQMFKGHTYVDNLILPTISTGRMIKFTNMIGELVKELHLPKPSKVTKVFNRKKVEDNFDQLLRSAGLSKDERTRMKTNLTEMVKNIIPKILKTFDCDESFDPKSTEFDQKLQSIMGAS